MLVIILLVFFILINNKSSNGKYIPAKIEGDVLVPGKVEYDK
mgnify:FL=1